MPPGEGAESHIHLRVTRERKAAYVRQASSEGKTLAAWCFEHLDKAGAQPPSATDEYAWATVHLELEPWLLHVTRHWEWRLEAGAMWLEKREGLLCFYAERATARLIYSLAGAESFLLFSKNQGTMTSRNAINDDAVVECPLCFGTGGRHRMFDLWSGATRPEPCNCCFRSCGVMFANEARMMGALIPAKPGADLILRKFFPKRFTGTPFPEHPESPPGAR